MDTNPSRGNQYRSDDDVHDDDDASDQPAAARARRGPEGFSTIREMARDFGVSIRALRFYEDRDLLHPKREGATRLYGAHEKRNLKMILKGKRLGFTLAEIGEMLRSQGGALSRLDADERVDQPSEEVDLELALPPEQIVAQIGYLERQRKELDAAIVALRHAHRRLLESPCRAAIA